MRRCVLVLASLALGVVPVSAQGLPADSVFDRMVGRWVLRGTIAGQQTTHDVTFEWLLGREYVRMHEVSRERQADGTPAYEAVVLFGRDPASGAYAALWLDNTGAAAFPDEGTGRGVVVGDSIPFLFGAGTDAPFHNTFVYHAQTDTWEWHLDNDRNGVREAFARVTLTRH